MDENGCPELVPENGLSCLGQDVGVETGPDADAGPACCPIADEPGCDCFALGGAEGEGGTCPSVCDAAPEGWVRDTDEHGCPVWTGGGEGSCLEPPDPCSGVVPPGCFEVDACAKADVAALEMFVRLPPAPSRDHDIVVFLPGGMGTHDTASVTYDRWLAGGTGIDEVIVAVPYAEDGNLLDEPSRALQVLDTLQRCTCHSETYHLGGTSAGGLSAFALMLEEPAQFHTLLGAPGAFRTEDTALLGTALDGKRIYLGVGGDDDAWLGPVRADHERLQGLGVDSRLVEWPGEGHVVSEAFDTTVFYEFWAGED